MSKHLGIELSQLAKDINGLHVSFNSHMNAATMDALKIGGKLLQSRTLLKGDKEYGKWRADNTTVSRQWANGLVRAVKKYGELAPPNMSISALIELAPASQRLTDSVLEDATDPTTPNPTAKSVRKLVKIERLTREINAKDSELTRCVNELDEHFKRALNAAETLEETLAFEDWPVETQVALLSMQAEMESLSR